jgi:phosphopantetheinyl transferase
LLHQLLAEKDKRIEEISQDRDRWRNLAEEQTLRLTNQTKSGPEPAQVLVAMGMLAILVAVVFLASTIT